METPFRGQLIVLAQVSCIQHVCGWGLQCKNWIYLLSCCRKKASGWFRRLLYNETSHSSQTLLGHIYISFQNRTHARSMFWLGNHSWADLAMCRTLVFVLSDLPLNMVVRLSGVPAWTDALHWGVVLPLSSGSTVRVYCQCGLRLLGDAFDTVIVTSLGDCFWLVYAAGSITLSIRCGRTLVYTMCMSSVISMRGDKPVETFLYT